MFPKIIREEESVLHFLKGLRLPPSVMMDILLRTAGEAANVRGSDPRTVKGFETWRWGTRFCRESEELKSLGWVHCEHNQIDGIRNDDLRVKLVACNMDKNAGNPDPYKQPKNVNRKGPANCARIGVNNGQLDMGFPEDVPVDPIDLYDFWYFGFHISETQISAEISRADSEVGGFINHYSERVILAAPGEIDGYKLHDILDDDFAEVAPPKIVRKKQ